MVKVKICGITNLEDALAAVFCGCDAIGFVFYKKSPRYIVPEKARNLSRIIPRPILKVGVFVNAKVKTIKHIARICRLDMLQFHGDESPEFCSKFKGYQIIKAFRVNPVRSNLPKANAPPTVGTSNGVKDSIDLEDILRYNTFAYLFDTFSTTKAGGTGKQFNWKLIKEIRNKIKRPLFLSGGLNTENVRKAIRIIHPDWVDASSSLEIRPGKKDKKKIREFIGTIRDTQL